ncbi:MarR family winged helix-turn-helix transcriptional regulator [Salinicola peritrichatus]|uniref:MarR family winged helix-turn-helix transcriptional regulator n=1 Tax=Salinicola peritrichatus TaxID=1267424 RepID=UPI0013A6471A|nr:MarR family winged helix-turn-helix transcriptional regulator [Salinicola peritrichatus]
MSEENSVAAGSVPRGIEETRPTVTPLPVERAPGFALRAAEQVRTALWRSIVGEFPSTPQLALLLTLDEPGPRHQQALADRIAVDKATLTALLATFESRGLSQRSADQRDARRRTVELTAQGRTTALAAMKTVSTVDTELLAPLDPDDRRIVSELWRTVAKTDGSPTPVAAGGLDATPGWWLRRTSTSIRAAGYASGWCDWACARIWS